MKFFIIIFVGFYFFLPPTPLPPQETRFSLSGTVQNLHSEGSGECLALSKGDGEQWAQPSLSPSPPATCGARRGQGLGTKQHPRLGGAHGCSWGNSCSTNTPSREGQGGTGTYRCCAFLCGFFFSFSFLFFSPLCFQRPPGLQQQLANQICCQPSLKGSLGSSASPLEPGGWRGPCRQGIPMGPGQSRAVSVELDFIHWAECLQPGEGGDVRAVPGQMGRWLSQAQECGF